MSSYGIRLARYSDLDQISTNHAASFLEDGMYAVLYPHRYAYYDDYVRAWRFKIQESWWDYNKIMVVSTVRDPSCNSSHTPCQETITGMAIWSRAHSESGSVWPLWGTWDPRLLIQPVVKFYHVLHLSMFGNRAMAQQTPSDPNPLTHLNLEAVVWPFMQHHFSDPPHRRNHWRLASMSVHPKHQGRGFGKSLVAWGLDRARNEGLPAVVIGGTGLEDFYKRCGFDILVGYATDGVDEEGNLNPLKRRGIRGGSIQWTRVKQDGEKLEETERAILVAQP